jgi:AcrR family transcriptional regulator
MGKSPAATQERIWSAAEQVFSPHGFSRASLRTITKKAGVNLAAVNYHFGSKEALYKQVLLRHIRAINSERMTLLNQAEQLAGEQSVPLAAITETFVRPLMRCAADSKSGGIPFLRLVSREFTDPQPFMHEELAHEFDSVLARYTRVLRQSLPGISASELFMRIQFMIGALLYTAAFQHDVQRSSLAGYDPDDLEACIRRLVVFCTAGLGAPVAGA